MTQLAFDLRRRRVLSLGGGLDSFALLIEAIARGEQVSKLDQEIAKRPADGGRRRWRSRSATSWYRARRASGGAATAVVDTEPCQLGVGFEFITMHNASQRTRPKLAHPA